jgi:hypothetical protein
MPERREPALEVVEQLVHRGGLGPDDPPRDVAAQHRIESDLGQDGDLRPSE